MNARIVMTHADHQRLGTLIDQMGMDDRWHFRDLCRTFEEAHLVDSAEVPADVVTMGSTVRLRELESGEWWTFTLCYPPEANIDEDRISVLSPVGTAIVGRRVGDVVPWPVPGGTVRIRIRELLYQPEAAGAHDEPELVGQ